nr:Sensor kinase CckA [Paraburkholderia busanensis]
MPMPDAHPQPVLILAPLGRDASVAAALLDEIGVASVGCRDVGELTSRVDDRTCCVVVTAEALATAYLRSLSAWIAAQPAWSDLPFLVLSERAALAGRNPLTSRLTAILGNVTFVERPFHPTTFASVVETAIRGRRRQFDARARMEQLHEGEARLNTALTAGNLGAWELDLSTWELTASATCRAIFGRSAEATFAYADLLASVHPEDRGRMRAAVSDSVAAAGDYAIEYRNVWPDGSVHWVDIRARFVPGERGKADRLVGVSSDVTRRRTAEDELRRVNESLEAKVLERTAELQTTHNRVLEEIRQREQTEDLLRQIQKLEMVGQLSGGIAHDFNNLLMAIIANLELARKETMNERTRKLLDGAFRGAQRGAALTQRLLTFARQQQLKVEPVRMSSLVQGMADLLERSIGSAIELAVRVGTASPPALLDANQVELAILNLVVNARDAMPNGGTLTLSVDTACSSGARELRAGEYVRVTVSDTGSGMDAATLARATEPFFTTKELGKGTGLGLSMIHGLALQLDGALRLESSPGKGTEASLWLPVCALQPADGATDERADASADEHPDPRAIILVVDDDPLIATSTSFLLEDLGHQVLEAASGAAALDVLRNGQRVDLLLTDYSMPRMTGLELAVAARELHPDLPVILATGYAELPEGAGISIPQLRKPYQQQQLVAEIRKALTGRLT